MGIMEYWFFKFSGFQMIKLWASRTYALTSAQQYNKVFKTINYFNNIIIETYLTSTIPLWNYKYIKGQNIRWCELFQCYLFFKRKWFHCCFPCNFCRTNHYHSSLLCYVHTIFVFFNAIRVVLTTTIHNYLCPDHHL